MSQSRDKVVVKTSIISIATNLVLVGFKVIIGFMANSIAVISDAVNNLSDALSSIIFSHPEVLQFHGFYLDVQEKILSFDIIIDFRAKDREKIYQDIYDAVHREFRGYKINITLDVDVSD